MSLSKNLEHNELATVLAALRLYQMANQQLDTTGSFTVFNSEVDVIAEDFETTKKMSNTEIDDLCQRLNVDDSEVTFAGCVAHFAATPDEQHLVQQAQAIVKGTEVEVDDMTVLSKGADDGVYVMGWVWVEFDQKSSDSSPAENS